MSLLPADSLKIIAESIGIANLSDEVAVALAQDIEYRLRDIVQEALKFMRHSRRTRLTTNDVNYALKVRNVERLYGYSTAAPLQFKPVTSSSAGTMFYLDDDELDFEDIVNAPMPKVPLDVSFTAHWLVVEGIQPAIPQNPAQIETKIEHLSRKLKAEGKFDLLDQKAEVKPLVRHVITKELQLYYEKITEALLSESEELRKTALESIAEDHGIQQLLPYFIQFVMDQLSKNLRVLQLHKTLLSVLEALLKNPNLFVEPYLHQFMPPMLTSIVARRMCEDPNEDHWAVRRYAASLMRHICSTYGENYHTLQPRVTRTLLRAFLDPLKALTTHYGAVVGLKALGPSVIEALVIPNLKVYLEMIKPILAEKEDSVKKFEAEMCYTALKECGADFIKDQIAKAKGAQNENSMDVDTEIDITQFPHGKLLKDVFGASLLNQ